MGETPDERRRAERVDVNFEFGGHDGAPTFVANLSEHGVFVQTDQLMPLGVEVNLRFTVLAEDPVVVEGGGRVVRHQDEPRGMGFEFTRLDPEMLLRINDVIRRNRPRDSGPPIVTPTEDELDASATQPRQVREAVLERRPLGRSGEDDEAAQTLVNLRAVDVEIIDDGDLPVDDGRDL